MEEDVDFVVLWVDGNDADWKVTKQSWANKLMPDNQANAVERFRDWDNFQYWFRSVEKNAPWVHKVYLVTNGQVPSWLNTASSKLQLINHHEIIPEQYLPTFSSSAIELCIKNIPGLCEHFVYFNDDCFLTRPSRKEDFFCNGLPYVCHCAAPVRNSYHKELFYHNQFSTVGLISRFDWVRYYFKHLSKWFSIRNGLHLINNIHDFQLGVMSGLFFPHACQPFLKSTMERTWSIFREQLEENVSHRFRTPFDTYQHIFSYVAVFYNMAMPCVKGHLGHLFTHIDAESEVFASSLGSHKYLSSCVNDSYRVTNEEFESIRTQINKALDAEFPTPSSFELS